MASKTLSEQLADDIEQALIKLQGPGQGHDTIQNKIVDVFTMDRSNVFDLTQQASARMDTTHKTLKQARKDGRLYPWVIPAVAALMFEAVFEASVGVWLLAGKPDDLSKIKPSVLEFVRLEVKLFAAMVGA